MAKLFLIQAINQALRQEMEQDPDVILLGEDIGINGGVFRATDGYSRSSVQSGWWTRRWQSLGFWVRPSAWPWPA